MTRQRLIHGGEAKNVFGVIETSMRNIAHEFQDDTQVLAIHFVAAFDSLADQPQNLQTTIDNLMLLCPCCCSLHRKTPGLKHRYIVFESLMVAKDSSRTPAEQGLFMVRYPLSGIVTECSSIEYRR